MKLKLIRKYKKPNYTIGQLYINDLYFCDVAEDVDRGLKDSMSGLEIKSKKVYGKTAIPSGVYKITLDVISPKYSKSDFYIKYANKGRVPRLLNVKGFEGVLIHTGNTAEDSLGCLILGQNKVKGKVINSKETFKKLYPVLLEANKKKEDITIEII